MFNDRPGNAVATVKAWAKGESVPSVRIESAIESAHSAWNEAVKSLWELEQGPDDCPDLLFAKAYEKATNAAWAATLGASEALCYSEACIWATSSVSLVTEAEVIFTKPKSLASATRTYSELTTAMIVQSVIPFSEIEKSYQKVSQ
ncbi:MAG: hypothetical protein ACYTEQ_05320 [Planctomycetota bacterium]|jgi:Tfp pilus assembly protein PilV